MTLDIMEIFRHRRSVRKYDGRPIPQQVLTHILEAGITAPTGDNRREVTCILIRDPDTLQALAHIRRYGTRMLETAGAAVLVLADAEKSDLWVEDASIAMAYMHLAADALGLGSCWLQMRARDDTEGRDLEPVLRDRFGFPENLRPLAILSLGYAEKRPGNRTEADVNWETVHCERW